MDSRHSFLLCADGCSVWLEPAASQFRYHPRTSQEFPEAKSASAPCSPSLERNIAEDREKTQGNYEMLKHVHQSKLFLIFTDLLGNFK